MPVASMVSFHAPEPPGASSALAAAKSAGQSEEARIIGAMVAPATRPWMVSEFQW